MVVWLLGMLMITGLPMVKSEAIRGKVVVMNIHGGGVTADYMGTNQWKWGDPLDHNSDGATTYYFYGSGEKLYDYIPGASQGLPQTALCHGMRLFVESRGYTVTENYNQIVDTQATVAGQGFSFADFKTEIDNRNPVIIHVTGHTMIGVGYIEGLTQTIYLHDTWDNSLHSMVWGEKYAGMTLVAVTVIHLAPSVEIGAVHTVVLGDGETVSDINFANHGPSFYDTVKVLEWPKFYDTIKEGYDAAGVGETIQVQIGSFFESPVFDRFIDVFLAGGFDAGFSVQTGVTNILGPLTIAAGSVTFDRILIQ